MDRRGWLQSMLALGAAGCSAPERIRTWDTGVDTGTIEEDTAPRCPTGTPPPKAGLLMPQLEFTAYIGNEGAFRKTDLCEYYDPTGKTKLLVLVFSGAWCGPCQDYVKWMAQHGAPILAQGVRFLDILYEGFKPMKRGDQAAVDQWLETYKSPMDTGIAEDIAPIVNAMELAFPTSYLIDPKTMKFIRSVGGFNDDVESDPRSPIYVINDYLKGGPPFGG